MARRKETSAAEDLMDLVAMLPWWVGVALALVLYVVLHRVASQQVATPIQPSQVGAMVTQTLAGFGQYLLPLTPTAGGATWRALPTAGSFSSSSARARATRTAHVAA